VSRITAAALQYFPPFGRVTYLWRRDEKKLRKSENDKKYYKKKNFVHVDSGLPRVFHFSRISDFRVED
jgi:hypothetical protein